MEDNYNNKCRACLTENDAMLSLFEVYEHDLTLAMILKSFINNIKISEDDGLPSYLCDSCILVLTQFYNFTAVYEESDRYLRSLYKKDIKPIPINIPLSVDVKELKKEVEEETHSVQEETNLVQEDTEGNVFTDSNSNDIIFDEEDDDEQDNNTVSDLDDAFKQEEHSSDELQHPNNTDDDTHCSQISPTVPIYEQVTKYECTICGDSHLYSSAFKQHMRAKHDMTDLDCDQYATKVQIKVFENRVKTETETHQAQKQSPEEGSYLCKYCKKRCTYLPQLQQHMKIHDKNKKFVCEVCGSRFKRKTYLDDHKEGHSTEKKHVCKFCGKAFRRRTVLRAHKRVHTHPNHYVCEMCGRAFTNSSTLKTHKLLIHIRERNFHCVICNLKFPLKSTLNKHILRHQKRENGEKGFNCSQCPMQYRDKSSLKRHEETKHQGRVELIPCFDCPKRYSSKANLMKHIKRHHNSSMVVAEEVIL